MVMVVVTSGVRDFLLTVEGFIAPYLYAACRLVFGTLYPAYASYKAVRTKNVKEYKSVVKTRSGLLALAVSLFSFGVRQGVPLNGIALPGKVGGKNMATLSVYRESGSDPAERERTQWSTECVYTKAGPLYFVPSLTASCQEKRRAKILLYDQPTAKHLILSREPSRLLTTGKGPNRGVLQLVH
ncbi:hypothetical protein BaRGS_00012510 [Batillaria attramentaria]|uniref:Uncharacterized protein n=1 Tax=Batillaria attramentaria TaxID=370345 RepID=A0ABD0LAT8_9CAEN